MAAGKGGGGGWEGLLTSLLHPLQGGGYMCVRSCLCVCVPVCVCMCVCVCVCVCVYVGHTSTVYEEKIICALSTFMRPLCHQPCSHKDHRPYPSGTQKEQGQAQGFCGWMLPHSTCYWLGTFTVTIPGRPWSSCPTPCLHRIL